MNKLLIGPILWLNCMTVKSDRNRKNFDIQKFIDFNSAVIMLAIYYGLKTDENHADKISKKEIAYVGYEIVSQFPIKLRNRPS